MAVSGTVHVEGKIDDRDVPSTSVAVTVEARSAWALAYPAEPPPTWDRGDSLPYPPITRFGAKIGNGVLGRFYGSALQWVVTEGTGPNAGVTYIKEVPLWKSPLLILVNSGLDASDPWYKAQVGPTANHPDGCGIAFVQREAAHVPVHEAAHYRLAQQFWDAPATGAAVESIVDFGSSDAAIGARIDSLSTVLGKLQVQLDSTDYGIQDCDPYPLPRR